MRGRLTGRAADGAPRDARATRGRRHLALLAAIALLAASLAAVAFATRSLDRVEVATIDARFATPGGPELDTDGVAVVGVDSKTARTLRTRGPLPRSLHARMIRLLREAKVRAIAYDLQFTEPTRPREDEALIDAIDSARPVVLATGEVAPGGRHGVLGGRATVRAVGARVGYSGLPRDTDGVSRRVEHTVSGIPAFSVATAETTLGRPVPRDAFDERGAWIDFQGPAGTFTTLSFIDVLRDAGLRARLRDKVVVVGYTDPLLQDVHPAPAAGGKPLPGPVIQATAVATVLGGFPLRPAAAWLDVLLIAVLAAVGPLASVRLRPVPMLAVAAAALAVFVVVAAWAFRSGTALSVSYAILALVLGAGASFALEFGAEARERRKIRRAFARFVPERVVQQSVERRESDEREGIAELVATVMFADLRGFTAFSERRPATEVVEVLNRYLSEMSDAIIDHGGTVVDYMGDGVMAVFGAPVPADDHADRALAAARAMLDERLPSLNEWLAARGIDERFAMGIGINSGPVISTNVGSRRRVAYSAIGDTTNTAARLEAMTKGAEHHVFVADSTRRLLAEVPPDLRFVGDLEVRGRDERVRVHTLGEPGRAGTAEPLDSGAGAGE